MINAIIKGLFALISLIASIVLSPIVSIITALFPDLATAIANVTSYFTTIVQYIPLCLDFFMIPREAVIFLFDYYVIKYTIYISVRAIKACIAVYNKIKV